MVIIDPVKQALGPPLVLQAPAAPPPYVSASYYSNLPSPPLRSPGTKAPPSPFSAPASNFLTVKRGTADITGTWNINTSLPFPSSLARRTSLDSNSSSDDARTEVSSVASSISSISTSASVPGTAAHPNLKLFSPRGRIDAVVRVSGAPRAWIEAISREEDVSVSFPPNTTGTPRPPIHVLARSTIGAVQVNLPQGFIGTLRVPSETTLPPSLKSRSVVLSPSEPPIERTPIVDVQMTRPRPTPLGRPDTRSISFPAPPRSTIASPPVETLSPSTPTVVVSPTQPSLDEERPPYRSSSGSRTSLGVHNALASRSSTHLSTPPDLVPSTRPSLRRTRSALGLSSASECSTLYFIGDEFAAYDTTDPERWTGDVCILDSEFGRVRVGVCGESVEQKWTDKLGWDKWKAGVGKVRFGRK